MQSLRIALFTAVLACFAVAASSPDGRDGRRVSSDVERNLSDAAPTSDTARRESASTRPAGPGRRAVPPLALAPDPSGVGVHKFVTAEVVAENAALAAIAREAGIDEMPANGGTVTAELPAEVADSLRARGVEVRVRERFAEVHISPGELETADSDAGGDAQFGGGIGCTDRAFGSNNSSVDIPDDPDDPNDPDACNNGNAGWAWSSVDITGFPNEVVCRVAYRFRVIHTFPGDLVLQINNSQHAAGDGAPVWDRYGGATDGGADDDTDDDADIYMHWRETSIFNGDAVDSIWYLDAWDHCPGDTGQISYAQFRVYYEDTPVIRVEPTDLTLPCGGVAARADGLAAGETGVTLPDITPTEKLIDAETVRAPFANGQATTDVIVTLATPRQFLATTDWNDPNSLAILQAEVKRRQDAVLARLAGAEMNIRYRYDNQAGFSGAVTQEGLAKLLADPDVIAIEPVRMLTAQTNQGIPLMNALATRPTFNGAGMSIAICDTGIDTMHPRLGGAAFPNSKVIGGYDVGDGDPDPTPNGRAHGTATAGIAAGDLGTVGDYIGGVADGARLYSVKIAFGTTGSASTAAMVAGWDWCVTHKNDDPNNPIMIISTSFGGGRSTAVCDTTTPAMTLAAASANLAGITVLASSGNDGYCDSMGWPACISNVISVGAVYDANIGRNPPVGFVGCISPDSCAGYTAGCVCSSGGCYVDGTTAADQVPTYSNTASFLDLLAPSNNAYTSDITGAGGYEAGNWETDFGGTSAACPYAAGAAAALQSAAMAQNGAYMTPVQVRTALVSTGNLILDGKVNITKPRVNLGAAMGSIPGCNGESFVIYNDGGTLNVSSITGVPSWLTLTPLSPYTIPPGGSQTVCVEADCTACDNADLVATLAINSDDPVNPTVNVNITAVCPAAQGACCASEGCEVGGACGALFPRCNDTFDCACFQTAEGGTHCGAMAFCGALTPCPNGTSDCGPGEACQVNTCCEGPVCGPDCGFVAAAGDDTDSGSTLTGDVLTADRGGPESCREETQMDCFAYGGFYWGDDTVCANLDCPNCDSAFVHIASADNSFADYTVIDHPLTNGKPGAILTVTQDWDPAGSGGVYNIAPFGVWYSGTFQAWTIFNQPQPQQPIPDGAGFNVEVLPPSDAFFIHVAAAGNIAGNSTTINDPLTNGNPNAILLVTQNLAPGGIQRNNAPIGVWYSSGEGKWKVFNEDLSAMPAGAAFNVAVWPAMGSVYVHVGTDANTIANFTLLDHPLLNGNPSAIVEATQNWTAGGGTYNNAPIGVWYADFWSQWSVFNEDQVDMPIGAAFNIRIASACDGAGPLEACCFMDATCAMLPRAICAGLDGFPQGPDTTCNGTTCPGPLGACCELGTCLGVMEEVDCCGPGATWSSLQTCSDVTCPVPPDGACCASYECTRGFDCASCDPFPWCNGSTGCACGSLFNGGIGCFDVTLPPSGACPNGDSDCANGEVCVIDTCAGEPVCILEGCPLGARAKPDGGPDTLLPFGPAAEEAARGLPPNCGEIPQDLCAARSGVYQGDDTFCVDVVCPGPPGACCVDGACEGVTDELSCLSVGGQWSAGETCATVTCPQRGACCAGNACGEPRTCDLRFDSCGGAFGCFCFEAAEGQTACATDFPCDGRPCPNGTSDCVTGEICIVNSCCTGPVCAPEGCALRAAEGEEVDWAGSTASGISQAESQRGITGSCVDLFPDECAYWGGIYQGDGTVCGDVACPLPTGACCVAGECTGTMEESTCLEAGGLWFGGEDCIDFVCPTPPQGCCFGNDCVNTPPEVCVLEGGAPLGVGNLCAGDLDGNGVDDACEPNDRCDVCGPGDHWIHSPPCPAGSDNLPSGATVGIDLTFDCLPDTNLRLHGPATVNRSGPLDDSVQFPGLRPTDGHLDVIDTEIVAMTLSNTAGFEMRAGSAATVPLRRSLGAIAEDPTNPSFANSFFEVFFEVEVGGVKYYNQVPLRVEARITCLPPDTDYIHPEGCIELYTSPAPGTGQHVGNLVVADHGTFLDCGSDIAGDCYTPHNTPYCDEAACCETVCARMPYCCEVEWSGNCAGIAETECPQLSQACCLPDGTCVDVPLSECSGFAWGPDTDCASVICTGACCFAANACADMTPDECTTAGQQFRGVGTECPTQNVRTAVHQGSAIVHWSDPAIDCFDISRGRGAGCIGGGPTDPKVDAWVTGTDGNTCHAFGAPGSPPIPAGFFGPGSNPFSGTVCFVGEPLGDTPWGFYDVADTLILRTDDPFDRCDIPSAVSKTIDIQIVALNLKSIVPILVTGAAGGGTTWNVAVDLSQLPSPLGTITAVKSHCNGGTYNSVLPVLPRFTFTRVGNPGDVQVLDTGIAGLAAIDIVQSDNPPWVADADPNLLVDSLWCTDFHPGIEDPIQDVACDCNANDRRDDCDACGDQNGNGVTEYGDYDAFAGCMGGPGAPASDACRCLLDADADGDLDLRDAAEFQNCFTGSAP